MAFAGSNADIFQTMQQTAVDIGSAAQYLRPNGQRVYRNTTTTQPGPVPGAWPILPDPAARACVSIRPEPSAVTSASLDSVLINFMKGAPPGAPSLLGLWHEASTMGYPISAANLIAAQSHIQNLAKNNKLNVKVGAIENATISNANSSKWMARNLDFYCCDIYDGAACSTAPSS